MKKQSIFLFLMLISMTAFGQIEKSKLELKPQITTEIPLILAEPIFRIVDEMPTLAMFNHLKDYEIRQDSSIRKMMNLMYKNLRCSADVEGMAVISFVIEKDGSMTNVKIVRDPGAGLGEEVLRVVKLFPNFEPGKIDGKPVRVQFNLPIRVRFE